MSGLSRREFFRASAATVAMTTPVAAAICPQDHLTADNMPFIVRLADEPDIAAVCVPAGRITHAYCYLLSDGRTIFAEQDRCNDGTGWRDCLPGEWDGRIVGRVVAMLIRRGADWGKLGDSVLAG